MTDRTIPREREILDELRTEGLRERMRERAKRRKSPWNALLIPLFPGAMVATWFGFLGLVVLARNFALDQHVTGVGALMRSNCQGFASGLCFVCSFFGAIPVGGLVCNGLVWCIGPARRAFER